MKFSTTKGFLGISLLASLLSFSIGLQGCSGKSKKKSQGTIQTLFVQGDPMEMVAGATFDGRVPFKAEDIPQLGEYSVVALLQITEKSEIVSSEGRDLEKENAPTESEEGAKKALPAKFVQLGPRKWSIDIKHMAFDFDAAEDGELTLKSLRVENESVPVDGLHYSVADGGQMFSLLAKVETDDLGRILLALTFNRKGPKAPQNKGNTKFNYVWGPGVLIPWDNRKTVEIHLCGEQTQSYADMIREGIQDWNHVLGSRLRVQVKTATEYPPFSDLNFSCLQVVDNYLMEYDQRVPNPGLTYSLPNQATGYIQDSDIFLMKREFDKYRHPEGSAALRQEFLRIVRHEFGHFLGLDHQFDGTQSIMSYDSKNHLIYNYDRAAIMELYPLLPMFRASQ